MSAVLKMRTNKARLALPLFLRQCYVVDTGKVGCFVRLKRGVSGRVLLKHLSDRFVSNPRHEFPPGKLVAGKVLAKVCAPTNIRFVFIVRFQQNTRVS